MLCNGNKISVIVPAYNAQSHLSECIKSIIRQPEVGEVLVIDDGSTDRTSDIANNLSEFDSRIKVIHQGNSGVSAARNNGLDNSTMPYLTFVDADDVIPDDAFASLVEAMRCYSADMIYGQTAVLQNGVISPRPEEFAGFKPGIIPAFDLIASLASVEEDSVAGACWRILYRASFLKDNRQRFPEGIAMSEDFCFVLDCLSCNPTVAYVNNFVYLLRREGFSTTQCYMQALEQSMDSVNERLQKICDIDERLKNQFWECVANTAWISCGNLFRQGSPFDYVARRHEISRILEKYRDSIKHVSLFGGLGWAKAGLLKVGTLFPWLIWTLLEAKNLLNRIKKAR